MKRIAVFDIDGTLIKGQSPAITVLSMFKTKVMPAKDAFQALLWGIGYKVSPSRDSVKVREMIFDAFAGMTVDEAHQIMTSIYESKIKNRIRQKGREAVRRHQEQGDDVIFVSATFDYIGHLIADELGAQGRIMTRMVIEDGRYTGSIADAPVEGEEKLRRLVEYANERYGEGNWSVEYSYGDQSTDIPILSIAEHPVAVDPKPGLKSHARKNGWDIQTW